MINKSFNYDTITIIVVLGLNILYFWLKHTLTVTCNKVTAVCVIVVPVREYSCALLWCQCVNTAVRYCGASA
jgi:hypothetical protein